MGILSGFAQAKIAEWASTLTPGMQLARRSWATVTYKPKGSDSGTDIADDVMQYLKSIDYTDNLADAVDEITLTLEDIAALWQSSWFPDPGAKLKVVLNTYNSQNLFEGLKQLELGEFEVDQIEVSNMPSVVQVKAVVVADDNSLRGEKQNNEWKDTNLSVILNDIAGKNGRSLQYRCEEDVVLEHVEQSDQSDLEFVQKLCKDQGFSLKVTSEQLIIYDEAHLEEAEPKLTFIRPGIPESQAIYQGGGGGDSCRIDSFFSWKMTAKTRDVYKACHVKYKEKKSDTIIESTFEAPGKTTGKTLEINTQVKTQEEADRLAKKKLREQNKDEVTCSFSLRGDFIYWAGETLTLEGFGHFDGKYIITKVAHKMGNGYTVDLDMRRCLDGY